MTTSDEHEALVRDCVKSIEAMPDGYVNPEIAENAARAILALIADRLEKPTEAMIEASRCALKNHIDALPPDVRAKSKEKGGVVFVGPLEKHAIRLSAAISASPLKPKKTPS